PSILFTRRTEHLPDHPGQVSFPGGSVERVDRGPRDTALRETFEEIGLGRERVEIAGYLDLYRTVTGFVVTPVVGLVRPGFALRLDPHEVAEAFEVPLDWLADRGNLQRQRRRFGDREVRFYAFQFEQYCIWGATAAMLVNLLERLRSDENKPINTMAWNPK
ncbi:MAG: CoA pyrophosphatase, partial [Gammaproteobacteria bacterium]